MKTSIGKKFITISPAPLEDIPNGLKIYLSEPYNEYSEPIATTNIIKGKSKYFYRNTFKLPINVLKAEIIKI